MLKILIALIITVSLMATMGCNQSSREPLPVITTLEIPYSFIDQQNRRISQELFQGKIYVADFFFTSCPTICPIMKSQMLRIYEKFKDNEQVLLLSHSIDPEHDTVEVLNDFGARLGIEADSWHLVTGDKEEIYDTAYRYGLAAMEDENAAGGFIHSGSFTLVDRLGQIRGYYQGTEEEAVDRLIKDIGRLIDEQ